jgi:parallel beta-helix repeat protein
MGTERVVAILFAGMFLLSGIANFSTAFNDPSFIGGTVVGDWYVNDTRTYTAVTINVVGNLIINSTGSLTLNNVLLRMNSSVVQTYRIEVRGGGQLYTLNNTRITSGTIYNYRFLIQSGATAQLINTNISRCGVMGGNSGNGLYIGTDNVLVQNCIVENGYKGICIEYANPMILNCTIRNNGYDGIYSVSSFPTIDGCNISRNGLTGGGGYSGVSVEASNSTSYVCRISNCTIGGNNLGVYFAQDSPGLVENCNISNSTYYGVRALQSSPVVRQNNISRNRQHGIYLEQSYALVDGNIITSNGEPSNISSGIWVMAVSDPVISGNRIASNTDTGINIRANCAPTVKNNNITLNTDKGIRFYFCGRAVVSGNNISFNYDGMISRGSTPVISGNRILGSQNDGLSSDSSDIVFENNLVNGTGMSGIHASQGSNIYAGNSTFSGGNQHGISVDSNSTVQLVNGNFSDEYNKAFQADAAGTLEWLVDRTAMIDGDDAVLRGNLTVMPGGRLALAGAHMDINSASIRRSIDVRAGGTIDVEGCNITAFDPAFNYKFTSSGTLNVLNSTIEEAGWAFGGNGENAGLFIGGGIATFNGSTVARNYCGLVIRSAHVMMESSDISGCEAAAADGQLSVLEFSNGTITGASQYLLQMDSASNFEMLNSTFDQGKARFMDGASQLNVSWFFTANVQWANLDPVQGASVNLSTGPGAKLFSRVTDAAGAIPSQTVRQFTQTQAVKNSFTPHIFNVTLGGLSNEGQVTIDKSMMFLFTFVDRTPPRLNITSPADPSYISSHTVEICGTASDPESGIKKVEVSWNNATWVAADTVDGYLHWNHTFQLIDAGYTIRARAQNNAGNISSASVFATVMVSSPYLVINSPKEGMMTNQSNITLSGNAARGATVTVNVSGGAGIQLANYNGMFLTNLTILEGHNTITVTARDAAGNTNVSTRNVTLDSISPWIRLELPRVSYSGQLSVEVNGTTDGDILTVNGFTANLSAGRFARTVMLNTGAGVTNTSIEVVARDVAGNTNRTTVYVLRDITPPDIRLTSPTRDVTLTNQSSMHFNGTTEPDAVMTLEGKPVQLDAGGNFSVLLELQEGTNVFELKAVDIAGNPRIVRRTVQRDSLAPALTITAPIDGVRTTNTTADMLGSTEPGAKVTVNGEEVQVGVDGLFSKPGMTLALGDNFFAVISRDQAGNANTAIVKVTRDEPPILPPQPLPEGPGQSQFLQNLPYFLILAIVLGGAGAAGWIVAAGRSDRRRNAGSRQRAAGSRQQAAGSGQQAAGSGQQAAGSGQRAGSGRMLTPTEMELASKDGNRQSDRPRTAEEMYGDDYAAWAKRRQSPAQPHYTAPLSAAAPPPRREAPPVTARPGPPQPHELSWEKVDEGQQAARQQAAGTDEGQQEAGGWIGSGSIPEDDFEKATGVDVGGGEEPAPTVHAQHDASTKKVDSDIDDILKKIGEVSKKK